MSRPARIPRPARRGFTLTELLVAIVLLGVCLVGFSMSSARFSRSVVDTTLRARAQALADAQIAMARTWPTYATLEELEDSTWNRGVEGLWRTTTVVLDTTDGRNTKRLTVTVRSVRAGLLRPDVVRGITVTAP